MALPQDHILKEQASRWDRLFSPGYRIGKVGLVIGFLSTAIATLVAHNSPATGYEVSIYGATPLLFWVLIGLGTLIALLVSIRHSEATLGSLALVLGGMCILSIISLPIIRGYQFYGLSDGLNHLAFTRNLAVGLLPFFDMLYPSGHSTAVLISGVAGISIPRAMLFVVTVCTLVFITFVPLTVREIVRDPRAVVLAGFTGFLLMPVTNVGTFIQFHPFSLATLFSPLVFYLLVVHIYGGARDTSLPGSLTPVSLLMPFVGLVLILYHPQLAFDVIVIFLVLAGLQFAVRRTDWKHPIGRTRTVYGQSALLSGLFYLWNSNQWEASVVVERTQENLVEYFLGRDDIAPNVESRQESAREIGITLFELFAKLFTVETVFAVIVLALVVAKFVGWVRLKTEADTAVTVLTIAGIVLAPYFFSQFLGEVAHHFFRHIGFVFVVVSILAPIALYHLWSGLERNRLAQPLLVVFFSFALILSVIAIYPSPYIFRHNHHVSEQHMSGFEESFANQPTNEPKPVLFRNTGLVIARYERALSARPGTPWYPGPVTPEPVLGEQVPESGMWDLRDRVASAYWAERSDSHLLITEVDRRRAIEAQDGIRYSAASFEAVRTQPMVHRVQTNGQFRSYYIDLPTPPGELYNVTEEQRTDSPLKLSHGG
ncbi:hypothetical protein [Halorientalis marina]|uniref:hypothetical protein n=1 Tax=Halorientalis marina TaxID=2931976 RepID=UPI001FF4DFF1|nr:hypothetical protein [Halorientalis marina]